MKKYFHLTFVNTAIVTFIFPFLLCPSSFALSWKDVTSLTENNNNSIKSAQKQAESSYWQYNRAMTAFLPQISASLGGSKTNNSATSTLTKSYSYGVSASQSLFTGFKNIFNLQSAYAQWQSDKANLDSTRSQVYYDLRSAYVNLLTAQQNVELQKKIVERRKSNTRLIGLRYKSGIEDKGNYLMTQADEGQSVYRLSSAKRDVELAALKLSQITGSDIATVEDISIPGKLTDIDYKTLTETSVGYRTAKYSLELADINRKSTVNEFLPSVSVSGNYSKSGSSWPPSNDSSTISLNMSYSLFPGGSNITDYFINGIKYDKALQDFENSKKNIRYGIEQTALGFNDSLERLSADRTSASASGERAEITQAKYLDGLVTFDEWNRTENDGIQAQITALNSKKTALVSQAAFYNSYGGIIK
ncbi:MAG: TolC family protein [Candidatus Saganbacteria bacterium]|nr:TolC family protein [Candidatus Saganbacteria bacterium]